MATAAQIDNAFHMAGMPGGRPTTEGLSALHKQTIFPNDLDSLVALSTDDIIRTWRLQLGETSGEITNKTEANVPGWPDFGPPTSWSFWPMQG